MDLRIQYVDDCPNLMVVTQRVRDALQLVGLENVAIRLERVVSITEAQQLDFRGSPTLLIDGRDPFADPHGTVGLCCRRYRTLDGVEGAPSVEDLAAALLEVSCRDAV
jgi:hypothetical protein